MGRTAKKALEAGDLSPGDVLMSRGYNIMWCSYDPPVLGTYAGYLAQESGSIQYLTVLRIEWALLKNGVRTLVPFVLYDGKTGALSLQKGRTLQRIA